MEIWYAVQYGEYDAWDVGSKDKEEALRRAEDIINNPKYKGMQVSIATIDVEDTFCLDVDVIQEGWYDDDTYRKYIESIDAQED